MNNDDIKNCNIPECVFTVEDLKKLLNTLRVSCEMLQIPMFASFALVDKKNNVEYHNTSTLATSKKPAYLTRISQLLLACNDADLVMPEHITNIINELNNYVCNYILVDNNTTLLKEGAPVINAYEQYKEIIAGTQMAIVPKSLYGNKIENMDIDDLSEDNGLYDYEPDDDYEKSDDFDDLDDFFDDED